MDLCIRSNKRDMSATPLVPFTKMLILGFTVCRHILAASSVFFVLSCSPNYSISGPASSPAPSSVTSPPYVPPPSPAHLQLVLHGHHPNTELVQSSVETGTFEKTVNVATITLSEKSEKTLVQEENLELRSF